MSVLTNALPTLPAVALKLLSVLADDRTMVRSNNCRTEAARSLNWLRSDRTHCSASVASPACGVCDS